MARDWNRIASEIVEKPFAMMAIGCAFAGAYAAMFNIHQTAMITTSMITLPAVYAMCGIHEIIAIAISCVVAFLATYLLGYDDSMTE